MRYVAFAIPLVLSACGPTGSGFTEVGESIPDYFPFRSDAIQHWEYINLDSTVSYKLIGDQSEVIENTEDGQVFAVNWTLECVSVDPYCVTGPDKTVKWLVDSSQGVFIEGLVAPGGAQFDYSPGIQLATGAMKPGDTVQTVTGGFTFTATYVGFDTCPVRWNVDWGDECVKLTLDDGDEDTATNAGLVGDYWAIVGFNQIAFKTDTDSDVWELSNWTCTGDGC